MVALVANPFLIGSAVGLILFSILTIAYPTRVIETLSLVTVNTLIANKLVWNLITCSIIELNIFKLLLDVGLLAVIPSEKLVTTPSEQFGLYLLFTMLACSVATSFYCLIRFFSTGLEATVMEPIYGFNGILVAFLMFARQTLKDTPLLPQITQINFHNISILLLLVQLLCWCIGLESLHCDMPFTLVSILFSWSYLRFFYRHANGVTGNADPDFSFIFMFPDVLLPVMIPFTTSFYNIFVMFGVFPACDVTPRPSTHHLRSAHVTLHFHSCIAYNERTL